MRRIVHLATDHRRMSLVLLLVRVAPCEAQVLDHEERVEESAETTGGLDGAQRLLLVGEDVQLR